MAIEHIAPLVWAPVLAGMKQACKLMEPRSALLKMQTGQLRKETKALQEGLTYAESVLGALNSSFELVFAACPEETNEAITAAMSMCSNYIVLIRTADLERDDYYKPRLNNIKQLISTLTKKVNKEYKKKD